MSALEHLTFQGAALASLIEAIAEEIATDAKVALERHLMLDEFDRFVGQGRRRHGKLRTQNGPPSDESGPELAPQDGFEPPTRRLTAACSTAELLRIRDRAGAVIPSRRRGVLPEPSRPRSTPPPGRSLG